MKVGKPGEASGLLVNLGVVLHRAGAKWVETGLNSEVDMAKVGEVPEHVELGDFGQMKIISCLPNNTREVYFWRVATRNITPDSTRSRPIEYELWLGHQLHSS